MLLNIVPKGLIDNKPLLIQVMAWCRIGNNLLHESILTQFSDIYIYICGFFSCDQAALRMAISVCSSVRLTVCPSVTPF